MKKKSVNILFVVIIGIVVGLQVKVQNTSVQENSPIIMDDVAARESPKIEEKAASLGITPDYILDYLSEIGFAISPVEAGKMSDIYTAKMSIEDTNIMIYVDIYNERKSNEIKLLETTIDGSYYVTYENQKKAEELVTKVAQHFLVPISSLPYESSKPEEARRWVSEHIPVSFSEEPKEKSATKIGRGTLNIYGTPLMRTFEMDFGYGEIDVEDL